MIEIQRPGLLTTVQDGGRNGYQACGVPVWIGFLWHGPIFWQETPGMRLRWRSPVWDLPFNFQSRVYSHWQERTFLLR